MHPTRPRQSRTVHATATEQQQAAEEGARDAVLRPGKRDIRDANFPTDSEGRTYHLGTKRGEVANRILSVGSEKRALMLAEYLEPPAPGRGLFMLESSRGFLTITGERGLSAPTHGLHACLLTAAQRDLPQLSTPHTAAGTLVVAAMLRPTTPHTSPRWPT